MQDYYRDFTSRFGPEGTLACACGAIHRLHTASVLVSGDCLEESAEMPVRQFGAGCRLWVLSDEATEEAAGRRWKSRAGSARIASCVRSDRPKVHPTEGLVQELAAEAAGASPDLLVSIGSGVISDLVKRLSLHLGVPNWCIATAPSVDAYSSGTSAVNVRGFHGSVPATPSQLIVCDLQVMRRAPREMLLAGLGDLLAKFLAFLDWNLSLVVTGEPYCRFISEAALRSARAALSAARQLDSDPDEAVRTLTDACLCSGFAMQALAGSRSAASAEHTMAHFWESAHSVGNPRWDRHGILTGAASRIVMEAYREVYGRLADRVLDEPARLKAFDSEPPWEETLEDGLKPYLNKVKEEMKGRPLGREALSQRLHAWRVEGRRVARLADAMLLELREAVGVLEKVGFPFSLGEIGIPREHALLPLRNLRLLRRRYSTFDLAYDHGVQQEMYEAARHAVTQG